MKIIYLLQKKTFTQKFENEKNMKHDTQKIKVRRGQSNCKVKGQGVWLKHHKDKLFFLCKLKLNRVLFVNMS